VKEKMKDKVKLSLSQKINGFFKFAPHPPWMLMYLFYKLKNKFSLLMTKLNVLKLFFLFYKKRLLYFYYTPFNDYTFLQIHIK
jgi:hypothetical protein